MKSIYLSIISLLLMAVLFTSCKKATPAGDTTLTIQPANNPDEGGSYGYTPNNSQRGDLQLSVMAWTVYGTPENWRSYVKFDQSAITTSNTIVSAKLYLYAMPTPEGGNGTDAMSGTANACYIQRITSTQTIYSYTWNNLPTLTTTHEVTIPQSTSATENDTLDVTDLVKDIQANGNNGLAIQLQNETYYNARQFASSYNTHAALRPKLVIVYH